MTEAGQLLPRKWCEDRPRQVYELALLGCMHEEIARVMDIDIKTLEYWNRNKPEFYRALQSGKIEADAKMAASFYKCGMGYGYEEEHMVIDKQGVPHKITLKKYQKPESWAANKWLVARRKQDWSETQRFEITNTNINITKVDLSIFNDQELKVLEKMGGLKQLTENAGNN